MTGQLPGLISDTAHEADLRDREDDPTPRGVVRAVVEQVVTPIFRSVASVAPGFTCRALDACAGSGVWSGELRRLAQRMGVKIHITAVEIDPRKREHLDKWADVVLCEDIDEVLSDWPEWCFSLAIGNPHFTALTHDEPGRSLPERLLKVATNVVLLHQEQSFQKSRAGARIWHDCPPVGVLAIPGSIRFRTGTNPKTGKLYGADSRCYQVTHWQANVSQHCELTMLPWLRSEARRWRVVPGTEDPSEDLPARPGWVSPTVQ